MSFFDYLFKRNEKGASVNWNQFKDEGDVDEAIMASNTKPQIIYKHSPSCAVSYLSQRNLMGIDSDLSAHADFYVVDVISQRQISLYISKKIGIRHESPQLLIIVNGNVVWDGSHYQVQADVVSEFLAHHSE